MEVAVALSTGEAIIVIALVALPIALASFALGAGGALGQVGGGRFALDRQPPPDAEEPGSAREREDEIRQMLTAKAYRQRERGEPELDVEAELASLLDEGPDAGADPELVAEVRQLVVASNERRVRQGREPLDVEAEVERRLAQLDGLDQ